MTSDLKIPLSADYSGHAQPTHVDRGKQSPPTSPVLSFAVILIGATALASISSHIFVSWLKVRTAAVTPSEYGVGSAPLVGYLAGSSLAVQALSWEKISDELNEKISVWGIAGGSPIEWEVFQPKATNAKDSFIVVSSYDLDEAIFCDFSAEIVPIGYTISALKDTHANWSYSERVLSRYPTAWLRLLFPTLGRSRGLMGQLHMKVAGLLHSNSSVSEAGPTLSLGPDGAVDEGRNGRISDWSEAERLRKLTAMRSGFQGNHSFKGLKHHALLRMLQYGKSKGSVTAIVLPVSPLYEKTFMTTNSAEQFESSLIEVQRGVPGVRWIRLDQIVELKSDRNFYDLVHMNPEGQQRTTGIFLSRVNDSN